MKRDITCLRCGKQITPEQVEVGQALVCPRCDPKARQRDLHSKQKATGSSQPR